MVGSEQRRGRVRCGPERGHAAARDVPRGLGRHQAGVQRRAPPRRRRQLAARRRARGPQPGV